MPSIVWERDTEDAWAEPYEYECQEQFQREATQVLDYLKRHYAKFDRDERTLEKAVWMLQVDSLEAITDALKLTEEKRHRIAARLFRDAVETMDISSYLYHTNGISPSELNKWYKNEVIQHKKFREFIRSNECEVKAKNLGSLYSDLSKYTHRTYNSISNSYVMARENKISYDGFRTGQFSVLPHVISLSYAVIGALIKRFVSVAEDTKVISSSEAEEIWARCLEKETVPRRFGSGPG